MIKIFCAGAFLLLCGCADADKYTALRGDLELMREQLRQLEKDTAYNKLLVSDLGLRLAPVEEKSKHRRHV